MSSEIDLERNLPGSINGSETPQFQSNPPDPSKKCYFSFTDISYSISSKNEMKEILKNISGCIEKGSARHTSRLIVGGLLALMGPSGSGKTTLLNILSRRLKS